MTLDYRYGEFGVWEKGQLIVIVWFYVLDIASDGYLAYSYYSEGQRTYFYFTLAFVLFSPFPTVFSNVRDFGWACKFNKPSEKTSSVPMRAFRFACTAVYPFAVVPRFVEYWISGVKFEKARAKRDAKTKDYFDSMNEEWRVITFIRLREAFLESAPQLTLHLYIMAKNDFENPGPSKLVPMILSLVSLAGTLATSRPLLRSLNEDETSSTVEESTWLGSGILTLAHILGIASRCMALSVIEWPVWIFVAVHFVLITIFLVVLSRANLPVILFAEKKHRFNRNKIFILVTKYSSLLLLAAISMFSYIHNKMRFSHVWYWLICLLENGAMLALYMLGFVPENEPPCFWFQLKLVTVHAALFSSSIALFTFFYEFEAKINKWGNDSKAYVLERVDSKFGCCRSESRNSTACASNYADVVELERLTTQGFGPQQAE